jgi:hypothetical protein
MPSFIFKESPEVDYYVEWSSIVEAPAFTGSRSIMLEHLRQSSDQWLRDDAPHHPERRLERADETGTTSVWVEHAGMRDKFAEEGAWDDDDYIYMQRGVLTRANLFVLCHRTDDDPDADVTDLMTPFEDEDEVRAP